MREDEQEVVRGEVLEKRGILSVDAVDVFDIFHLPYAIQEEAEI